jgi:DNA-binding PadR family transcriptional regulator
MHDPRLPPLTHLQFLILSTLLEDDRSGREMRTALDAFGAAKTAAAFYQTMARLERAGLVDGWYDQIVVGDQAVTERRYTLKPLGRKLVDETRRFYTSTAAATLKRRLSNG